MNELSFSMAPLSKGHDLFCAARPDDTRLCPSSAMVLIPTTGLRARKPGALSPLVSRMFPPKREELTQRGGKAKPPPPPLQSKTGHFHGPILTQSDTNSPSLDLP